MYNQGYEYKNWNDKFKHSKTYNWIAVSIM